MVLALSSKTARATQKYSVLEKQNKAKTKIKVTVCFGFTKMYYMLFDLTINYPCS